MAREAWDERYVEGDLPWDTGTPERLLVDFTDSHLPDPITILEIGCGTGTNAIWLASRGHTVVGVDISPKAIEMARDKADKRLPITFAALDFFQEDIPGAPFDLVFDRGCFHTFDTPEERALFAERVARHLDDKGRWLSLIGSTEGRDRDHGPPRRSARDVVSAVEPVLEIVELRSERFHADEESHERAWLCLSRVRNVPAQPSTRRE